MYGSMLLRLTQQGNSAMVQSESSSKVFRFGDGKCYEATRKVTIPAMIGDTEVQIETQAVNCALPLLLSKNSIQKAGTKINFQKYKAIMFDKEIGLRFTTSKCALLHPIEFRK